MIRTYTFSQGRMQSRDIPKSAMPALLADNAAFLWVDFEKADPEEARAILDGVFHFHPLSIEDCIMDSPAPKVEEYTPQAEDQFTNYLFLVMHGVDYNRKDGVFATSELNLFLGRNFLVTYHDVPLQTIAAIEDRCVRGGLNVGRAPDRLAYLLLDALVDNYKPALDELSLEIAELEQRALHSPRPQTLKEITGIKREVLHLRQIIVPQSEVLARLAGGGFKLIRPHLAPYYRDVYDGLMHISALAQGYTDSLTGTLQVYLSMSSNQTGEVVKLLTLITVITTPLMLIGTWYGMNFKDMPELGWPHGYAVAVILAVLSTAVTWWYFRRKKWF